MRNILHKIFILFIVLLFNTYTYSQNTVIHDIPWHSDTIGMWGSGSSAWSINQVDTLADITVGPYSDNYSMVYNIPFPISDSVGVIFDYGAFVDMQLIFAMTGWSNGAAKVNYPTKITMEFPPNGSFSNGAWETIPSEYREQDTIVHPTDTDNWDIYADWPDAGKIELFLNLEMQAHADLIYSDPSDPLNITWDTIHVFNPINIDLDTFDIFLADVVNNEYVIPWVAYHTDPITGTTVIDSVYFLHDSIGWPLQFPQIFYDLIGISGDISIPDIQNYTKWIENEQRLYTWGSDEYMHINLDIIKFLEVMTSYLSNIPSMQGLTAVSQAFQYEEGDTSIYIFTDPVSGEDFTANLQWDLIDAELLFTNTMNQTLSFEDNQEYSFFGIPIGPSHYPNVWNVFEFPIPVDYNVLDTLGATIESGTSDSVKFCADYDLQLRLPCVDYDTLPVTISHTIDPWLTNMVRDSIDVDFYIKVLDISYSLGTPSDTVLSGSYLLYLDTIALGTFAGPPLFGPPLFMPWQIDGFFIDTTFVPDVAIIPENNPLSDSLVYSNILCYGTNTGSVAIIGIGGSQPYSYNWTDENGVVISTDSAITNVSVGTYYVTITDDNNCYIVDSATLINTNTQIIVNHTSTDVLCYGDSTGTAIINVTGGSPPYQFNWDPNIGNTQTVSNLYEGTFYVTVSDNVGCFEVDTISIVNLFPPIVITNQPVTNITCYNGNDGAIDIDVSGGLPNYNYIWSNAEYTQDINNLTAGNYTVTVIDNNYCTKTDSFTLSQPPEIIITTDAFNNISCYGGNDGFIQISITGGVGPYTYNWQTTNGTGPIANQQDQNNLSIGTYYLTVTDASNCTQEEVWTLTQPDILEIQTDLTENINCFGGNDGSIHVSILGGAGAYSYNWQTTNGLGLTQGQQDQDNLTIGTYNLTVTDGNNCTVNSDWTLTEPDLLVITKNATNITCHGEVDGKIDISVSGGVTPYTYYWETINGTGIVTNDQNQSDLTAGTYYLTVTDAHSCISVKEINIIEPNEFIISSTNNQNICLGDTALVDISATGGTLPYTFYWNGAVSTHEINVITNTDTTLIATGIDASGCESNIDSSTINISPEVNLSLTQNSNEVCIGDEVIITPEISGGVQPYIYTDQYGNILSEPIIYVPENTGDYTISVQDICETKSSSSIYVTVNQSPTINISADINYGCVPLKVNFVNTVSNGDYYIWDFGDNFGYSSVQNPVHYYNQPGTFSVTLTATSDKGCVNSNTLENYITVYPKPKAKFIYSPLVPSFINPEVSFENLSEGGNAYLWNFGDDSEYTNELNPIHIYKDAGNYLINLITISNYGCRDTVSATLEVIDGTTFYAPTAFSPDNDDINNDFFVVGTGIKYEDFSLIVYDRWGEIIWQTSAFYDDLKQSEKWNGTGNDNKIVESGVYKWLVKYKDFNGISHEKSGNVTVIR